MFLFKGNEEYVATHLIRAQLKVLQLPWRPLTVTTKDTSDAYFRWKEVL